MVGSALGEAASPRVGGAALVRAEALSQALGVSRATVYRMARAGRIPSVRLGGANGAVRFDPEAVARAVLTYTEN